MTEAEAIGALAALADTVNGSLGLYFSCTFAYLTVAHFLGPTLSRVQCLAVSVLYALTGGLNYAASLLHTRAWELMAQSHRTVYQDISFAQGVPSWTVPSAVFGLCATGIALYFMYSVRAAQGARRERG